MNRRIVISLILLLLLILLLAGEANLWPPKRIVKKTPKKSNYNLSLQSNKIPLDEGISAPPETEGESASEELKPIVAVLHHSGWMHNGYYEVFGELENTGQLSARNVSLHVIFKDGAFNTVATVNGPADHRTIAPGQMSKFKVVLKSKENSSKVGSYIILPQISRKK
ncbi:MAG TPA: hypothetical protein ENH19_03025 [Actinobacteria bacterium]|nr:hypothetical protein [Actinomycetes bacterium]HEX21608.1 hypothetical protein [Actinomycetota bacterium]